MQINRLQAGPEKANLLEKSKPVGEKSQVF